MPVLVAELSAKWASDCHAIRAAETEFLLVRRDLGAVAAVQSARGGGDDEDDGDGETAPADAGAGAAGGLSRDRSGSSSSGTGPGIIIAGWSKVAHPELRAARASVTAAKIRALFEVRECCGCEAHALR